MYRTQVLHAKKTTDLCMCSRQLVGGTRSKNVIRMHCNETYILVYTWVAQSAEG